MSVSKSCLHIFHILKTLLVIKLSGNYEMKKRGEMAARESVLGVAHSVAGYHAARQCVWSPPSRCVLLTGLLRFWW